MWAISLAAAASRTTNPLLLGLVLAVLAFVVSNRRSDAPWARAFRYYFLFALVVVGIRVVFRTVFATGITAQDHILFTLPTLQAATMVAGIFIVLTFVVTDLIAAWLDPRVRLGARA